MMKKNIAKIVVYAYAVLFALGALCILWMITLMNAGNLLPRLALPALILLHAFASAGLFLKRSWGRILTIIICVLVFIQPMLLLIPGSRLLWGGAGAVVTLTASFLVAAFGIFAFGFDKDVKTLFKVKS